MVERILQNITVYGCVRHEEIMERDSLKGRKKWTDFGNKTSRPECLDFICFIMLFFFWNYSFTSMFSPQKSLMVPICCKQLHSNSLTFIETIKPLLLLLLLIWTVLDTSCNSVAHGSSSLSAFFSSFLPLYTPLPISLSPSDYFLSYSPSDFQLLSLHQHTSASLIMYRWVDLRHMILNQNRPMEFQFPSEYVNFTAVNQVACLALGLGRSAALKPNQAKHSNTLTSGWAAPCSGLLQLKKMSAAVSNHKGKR